MAVKIFDGTNFVDACGVQIHNGAGFVDPSTTNVYVYDGANFQLIDNCTPPQTGSWATAANTTALPLVECALWNSIAAPPTTHSLKFSNSIPDLTIPNVLGSTYWELLAFGGNNYYVQITRTTSSIQIDFHSDGLATFVLVDDSDNSMELDQTTC